MILVSNTGPIIALAKINRLHLLKEVFQRIVIPKQVQIEIENSKFEDNGILKQNNWIEVQTISLPVEPLLKEELDKGEVEAITLSKELKSDLLFIDERKGRRIAENFYNIKIIGSAGMLLKFKKANLVSELKPLFIELKEKNYFIAEEIVAFILKEAKEL